MQVWPVSLIHCNLTVDHLTKLQETAKFNGQFFADPSRKLYHALGMDIENTERTPKGQQRPSYLTLSPISNIMQSLWVTISD